MVVVDIYLPERETPEREVDLLLLNDGQDLRSMAFEQLLGRLSQPPVCLGIHCGPDRKYEYGVLSSPDYMGRGAGAGLYRDFVLQELLPFFQSAYPLLQVRERSFAGFSLGALSAFDLVWNYPGVFTKAGLFSGAFWWRSKDTAARDYDDHLHRLAHRQVREGSYHPGLQFFFMCGEQDEHADRNHNGVIDAIDDTLDLMRALLAKGYLEGRDMRYWQLPDGKHDVATWARAMPAFLAWGWGKEQLAYASQA